MHILVNKKIIKFKIYSLKLYIEKSWTDGGKLGEHPKTGGPRQRQRMSHPNGNERSRSE